ncbi:D-glycero-beta-D-manno-heptose 1-phosphate adenylyltransferase [Brumimicrobium salinarum]|uniref:D-glycero-beta-D-manno-heptose 1-phosphate adenylyltransferase n=1 Tax=Brumimicrobium salinarum TaxID=2058658 RepID=A0A2I0R4B1_9FLAO|nr:D-glycero-beta-D-manno-heptose 1-phosphate adenylyltransferase [Brumimicrobium salinarum]PKR81389.1 D-glycero-beta-D-manno-heptose 1-phosphate adenylyltransferase [Brumimicrobium salinarum]
MKKWQKIKSKCADKTEATSIISTWKSGGEEVVFTNGCFDILHLGHVSYLAKAASLGDRLVVAVNSDDSVRRLGKGSNRPVNTEEARALIIASLEVVDLVIVFSEDTPLSIIESLSPTILVKGADYDAKVNDPEHPQYIVGANEVKSRGGKVQTIAFEDGYSTTGIIEKLK